MKESCLIIAGELSGEEHAQSFFPELKKQCPEVHFWGVGGDYLESQGVEILYHLKTFSSWGITEVVGKMTLYLRALNRLEEEVKKRNCQKAILIDYQTFNLKLAMKLKKLGVDVLYYVAPQAWAWKAWRVPLLASSVHTLFCLLPFEKKWFQERGVNKIFSIPHPLFKKHEKALLNFERKRGVPKSLLLLPGSRKNEIRFLLPAFLKVAQELKKKYQLSIEMVKASSLDKDFFEVAEGIVDTFYEASDLERALMKNDIALAASGTVTLSCALFSLPTVVCYGGSLVEEFIFQNFVKYSGSVSLGNIIHEESVFPEVLGDLVYSSLPQKYLEKWLTEKEERELVIGKLEETSRLVQGESLDLASYMGRVIRGEGAL